MANIAYVVYTVADSGSPWEIVFRFVVVDDVSNTLVTNNGNSTAAVNLSAGIDREVAEQAVVTKIETLGSEASVPYAVDGVVLLPEFRKIK